MKGWYTLRLIVPLGGVVLYILRHLANAVGCRQNQREVWLYVVRVLAEASKAVEAVLLTNYSNSCYHDVLAVHFYRKQLDNFRRRR
jgi:hypothetical protein